MADYTIATKLTEVCASIVPFYLSEAESEDYPYAAYDAAYEKPRTKDGVYKTVGDVTIHVVSNDFDEADEISEDIQSAVETSMNSDGFTAKFIELIKSCVEGIWTLDIRYSITQR